MSVHMTTAVRKHSKARNAARLVLLTLADYADHTGLSWPSVAALAADTLLGESTVRKVLADLVAAGELSIATQAGPRGCNLYRITLDTTPTPSQIETPLISGPPLSDSEAPLSNRADTPLNLGPEPLENHQEPPPPPTPTTGEEEAIDVPGIAARVLTARLEAGYAVTRWRASAVADALTKAVDAGMPPNILEPALLMVAVDPATEVPGRLAKPGPWWDVGHTVDLTARRNAAAARRKACDCTGTGLLDHDDGRVTRCPKCRPAAKTATR